MASSGINGVKAGYFYKQGATVRNWKRRYFIMDGNTLSYYKTEGDQKPKGAIILSDGRGVRKRGECKVEWPSNARDGLSFGLATASRTYYIYTTEIDEATVQEWMMAIQRNIGKRSLSCEPAETETVLSQGQPTDDWENDIDGKAEGPASKIVRGAVKMAAKITKTVAKDSGLDEKYVNVVDRAADVAEKQADADPNASWKDRAKIGASGAAGLAGATLHATSDLVPDEIGAGTMNVAGTVLEDQADADTDLSIKQRLVLAGGSTLAGVGEEVGIEGVSETLEVAGGIVKDQAEVDEDTNWKQRVAIGIGSAADGIGGLEVLEGNMIAERVTSLVGKAAEVAMDELEEGEEGEEN